MREYGTNSGKVIEYETESYFVQSLSTVGTKRGGQHVTLITHKPTQLNFMMTLYGSVVSLTGHIPGSEWEIYHQGDIDPILEAFPEIAGHLAAIVISYNLWRIIMPTRVEKEIRAMDDKRLLYYIYIHIDRAQFENTGILKNIMYIPFVKTDEEKEEKRVAAMGYGVDQLEHLTNLRFAMKEMHLRMLRTKKRCHRMAVNFEKLRGDRKLIVHPEVAMPDLLTLGEDLWRNYERSRTNS